MIAEVANEEQVASIRHCLAKRFHCVFVNGFSPDDGAYFSPGYSFFIFRGLYALKMPELAERLMRQGWGWMLAQGAATTPEFFDMESSNCHAWSASPMYFLSRYGLGVTFTEAPDLGVAEIDIQSELDWAAGAVPIPGTGQVIEIRWTRRDDGLIEVAAQAPENVTFRWDASRIALRRIYTKDAPLKAYERAEALAPPSGMGAVLDP